MFEIFKNKDLRNTYIEGFLRGFNSAAYFWEPKKFEMKSLDEMNKEAMDKAWYDTGKQLRDACLMVEKKYGLNHE
jgi:hypothetical protein